MSSARKVLIMAGGTGGHVFPALATADCLRQQGTAVEWLGTAAGIEAEVVPAADIKLHCIDVKGLRGKGRLSLLLAPFKLLFALYQAWQVLRKVKPDAVLGMGGFASGPGGLAAWLTGVPVVVHEQNAYAGMTNKILSKMATRVLEAFGGAFQGKVSTQVVGNPVRGNILKLPEPKQRFEQRQGAIRLLVVGGSLGAKAINDLVPQVIAQLPEGIELEVWHQVGKRNLTEAQQLYAALGLSERDTIRVVPFIERMDEAYGWADLVLCRAGALTVSELSIAGVASVLVPFPYAVDDHQTGNARFLSEAGAALLVQQTELSQNRLTNILTEQLNTRETLLGMAEKSRHLAQPEASQTVADICLEVMKK
ncbi:undecaprenyldiphospho-muramoylpentapeptide beta-N-acetylglucosaminyltransferase [Amphritea balenae]|uniref:UDP-N-acetylglucosamine--N-acetylmuramyl-(pentapeptide) pyrophosphoryl-undecaprenol N-acetylglucosamine transferase n=1 Tax=Amphritea balenae TaxID=452629 RepID=A0A3P1SSL4_9GAMM|nr:undecaprenyldiphospho-muramoylpentapeptide beta-N-acetylglucosaminyltransferase [Amphritea balenae]RRD00128.1 undecaprenyldiphospho-muramoylpentapeptide beta-N-acetylglucosaminyltransferase [Amphritea balenae]GGK76901.1 UDP-N-acetylglucosamine--N-acetylmuramyl-(pentapeptide) pyrophosphoryl-undecaprenol N-acetylglucosamine transferase [Amphritea balenae]